MRRIIVLAFKAGLLDRDQFDRTMGGLDIMFPHPPTVRRVLTVEDVKNMASKESRVIPTGPHTYVPTDAV